MQRTMDVHLYFEKSKQDVVRDSVAFDNSDSV